MSRLLTCARHTLTAWATKSHRWCLELTQQTLSMSLSAGRIVKRDYKLVGSHVQQARDLMHESRKQVLERFQKQQSAAKTR